MRLVRAVGVADKTLLIRVESLVAECIARRSFIVEAIRCLYWDIYAHLLCHVLDY